MTMDAMLPYRVPRSLQKQPDNFVEGEVYDVTAEGMRFTIKSWDGGKHVFGPAPWPKSQVETADLHSHEAAAPARGVRCLILFLGGGVDRPWVLGVWP